MLAIFFMGKKEARMSGKAGEGEEPGRYGAGGNEERRGLM